MSSTPHLTLPSPPGRGEREKIRIRAHVTTLSAPQGRRGQGEVGCWARSEPLPDGPLRWGEARPALVDSGDVGATPRERPVGPHEVAGIAVGKALEIILVLGLGFPEVA